MHDNFQKKTNYYVAVGGIQESVGRTYYWQEPQCIGPTTLTTFDKQFGTVKHASQPDAASNKKPSRSMISASRTLEAPRDRLLGMESTEIPVDSKLLFTFPYSQISQHNEIDTPCHSFEDDLLRIWTPRRVGI